MNIVPAEIMDVLLIEPLVFEDDRGFFYYSCKKAFTEKLECQFISSKTTNLALITTSCAVSTKSNSLKANWSAPLPEPSLTSLSICEQARHTFGQSVSTSQR